MDLSGFALTQMFIPRDDMDTMSEVIRVELFTQVCNAVSIDEVRFIGILLQRNCLSNRINEYPSSDK